MQPSGSGKAAARSIANTMHNSRMGVSKMSSIKVPSRPTSAVSRPESALEAVFSPVSRKSPSPTRDEHPGATTAYYAAARKRSPARQQSSVQEQRHLSAGDAQSNASADDIDPFDAAIAALAIDFPLPQFRPSFASPLDSTDPMYLLDWSWHRTLNRSHPQLVACLKKNLNIADPEAEAICDDIQTVVCGLRSGKYSWNAPPIESAAEEETVLDALKHVLSEYWCPKLHAVWRCALVHIPKKK
jgi:hypothetical protein